MKKIPNLFERDWNGDKARVLPIFNPNVDVSWVIANEGRATIKFDGSAVLIRAGKLFVRYDAKRGKAPPPNFEPCQDADPNTGHQPGWIPAEGNPAAKWHLDAFINTGGAALPDGTYEALGPQHQTNPYRLEANVLVMHGVFTAGFRFGSRAKVGSSVTAASAFNALKDFLDEATFFLPLAGPDNATRLEGIVFHHDDGRMVKVLSSDLGLSWKAKTR